MHEEEVKQIVQKVSDMWGNSVSTFTWPFEEIDGKEIWCVCIQFGPATKVFLYTRKDYDDLMMALPIIDRLSHPQQQHGKSVHTKIKRGPDND